MFRSLRTLVSAAALVAALAIPALFIPASPFAQGFNIPNKSNVLGQLNVAQGPTGQMPVGVGCTIVSGSTDMAGSCTTTATSGSITFSQAYESTPHCIVYDRTATPVAVYSASTTAITLTTITSAHSLGWLCLGKQG